MDILISGQKSFTIHCFVCIILCLAYCWVQWANTKGNTLCIKPKRCYRVRQIKINDQSLVDVVLFSWTVSNWLRLLERCLKPKSLVLSHIAQSELTGPGCGTNIFQATFTWYLSPHTHTQIFCEFDWPLSALQFVVVLAFSSNCAFI